jgi:hypothetical protein
MNSSLVEGACMPAGRLPIPRDPEDEETLLRVISEVREVAEKRQKIMLEIAKLQKQLGVADIELALICRSEILNKYVGSPRLAKIIGTTRGVAERFMNISEFEIEMMRVDSSGAE